MNAVVQLRPHTDYTGHQLALIRRTVAADTNTDEFDLFMEVARRAQLDPFRKQISAIVFSKNDDAKRKMSIITTIDGLRAIAARSGRYRPDEEEAAYEYDDALKGPDNPAGLVKASVTIWIADAMREGGWKPVKGWAYWSEFAPIKEEGEDGYTWEETGQFWADSGKPKMRKVPKGDVVEKVDGNWAKMPRVMIAKCAEAQAIRKAFPEDTSGLYERAEMDRAIVLDLTASEIIGAHDEETRLRRIGASNAIMIQLLPTSPIEPVPLGQVADRVMDASRDWTLQHLRWFMSANTHPLREFWARAQTDALALKQHLEDLQARLLAAEQEASA